MRIVSLGFFLYCFWLVLSGHYTPLFFIIGLFCAGLCVVIALRMRIVDLEGHPVHLIAGAPKYFAWLVIEIVKATLDVTRIILNPKLPISPSLVDIKATQKTHLGVSIYGNSITLTPGTITVEAQEQDLKVHALTLAGRADLETGEMDRRVTEFEGES